MIASSWTWSRNCLTVERTIGFNQLSSIRTTALSSSGGLMASHIKILHAALVHPIFVKDGIAEDASQVFG